MESGGILQVQNEEDGGSVLEKGVQPHDGRMVQLDMRLRLAVQPPIVSYAAS